MATYYVNSAAAGTNSGASWTNAYTAFASAVAAATASGDIIKVHYTHQENLGANTTYTFLNNVIVVSVDKDSSDVPTPMAESGWIGSSTTARTVSLAGAFNLYFYGITLRFHGASGGTWNNSDGAHMEFESCKLWASNTASSATHSIGSASNSFTRFVNCEFKSSRTSTSTDQYQLRGDLEFVGCSWISANSGSNIFPSATTASSAWRFFGCNFSGLASGATYFGNNSAASASISMVQCELSASATLLATQTTVPNKASAKLWVYDCSSGDTHLEYAYYDAFGSLALNRTVYFTTTGYSWKIDTSANCSYYTPFSAPVWGVYHSGSSSITPYVEILRDGSTTAYQNDEVWLESGVKNNSGVVRPTFASDKCALADKLAATTADQAAGAGLGSWTGEGGSAWSGKIDRGTAATPAEAGDITAMVFVGEPSITVYVDPVIRT